MTSKWKLVTAALACASMYAITGCGEFLRGEPKKPLALEIKQEATGCLKQVSLDFNKFIKSEAVEQDIEKTFKCIDDTLKEFQGRVEGKENADAFNADELTQIFDKFIKDAKISKAATEDLLLLKTALIGGVDQKITKHEISQLRELLLILKAETKNMMPFAKLLMFKHDERGFSLQTITDGFNQLNLSLKKLMKATRFSRSAYNYEDFKKLLVHLKLLNDKQDELLVFTDKLHALIAGSADLKSETEREQYIDSVTQAMKIYSMNLHGHVKFSLESPDVVSGSINFLFELMKFMESTPQYKNAGILLAASIDPILSELHRMDILPVKISKETALSFYKMILVRVYSYGIRSHIKEFRGLEAQHLLNFRKELSVYKIMAEHLQQLSVDKAIPIREMQKLISGIKPEQQTEVLAQFDDENRAQVIRYVNEIKDEMLKSNPVRINANKILIDVNPHTSQHKWQDAVKVLHYMMLSRQLILGWGDVRPSREMTGASLGEQGMIQWNSEFKRFAVEIKTTVEKAPNSGANTLKSANLLTQEGNGDKRMNFAETIELNSILLTAGSVTTQEILQDLTAANCNLAEKDVFGNFYSNEKCVLNDLQKNYKKYFGNLPHLIAHLSAMSPQQFEEYFNSIMDVARATVENKGVQIETADIRTYSTLMHYIESLFVKFDKNKNMKLSADEIRESYAPRFKEIATSYAKKNSKEELEAFASNWSAVAGYGCFTEENLIEESFIFLVLNYRTPKRADLNLVPCMTGFKRPLVDHPLEVDRTGIINTFKILKSILGS